MLTLYHALLAQHQRQLTSVRCAEQTIAQLHRYFEDVVLENNLSALVIESLPFAQERAMRDVARVRDLGRAAKHTFFFAASGDALHNLPLRTNDRDRETILIKRGANDPFNERFIVVADSRFSALLASVRGTEQDGEPSDGLSGNDVIWTFEPDIVYSALEYLMARVGAERPFQAAQFSTAVRSCMPKATSLQLTVSVTTKLARLLQEQAGREIAVNRIATAIRSTLEVPAILQTTVDEVGRALNVQHCALRIEGEHGEESTTRRYARGGCEGGDEDCSELLSDLNAYSVRLSTRLKNFVLDGRAAGEPGAQNTTPLIAVPLIYQHDRFIGTLIVRSADATRVWQENEMLLMRTVADQVAVAVNHARLFAEKEKQALTDGLTGCCNRRSFEIQLEKDLQLATRMRQPLSLIMLDIDHFKRVNDTFGHDAGDEALRALAEILRAELRGVDTAARYGGEEFVVILPQANTEGAMVVAERLRARIEAADIARVGHVTASLGVATFPIHASSREQLVKITDTALYAAKHDGRNKVCLPPDARPSRIDEMFEIAAARLEAEAESVSDERALADNDDDDRAINEPETLVGDDVFTASSYIQ